MKIFCFSSTHKVFHSNAINSILNNSTNNGNNFNSISNGQFNSTMILNNNNIYKFHQSNNLNNNPFHFYTQTNHHATNSNKKSHLNNVNSNSIDFSLMGSMENANEHGSTRNMINLKGNNFANNVNNNSPQTHNSSNLYFLDENFKISTKKNAYHRNNVSNESINKSNVSHSKDDSTKTNGNTKNSVLNHHNSFRLPQVKPFDCKLLLFKWNLNFRLKSLFSQIFEF